VLDLSAAQPADFTYLLAARIDEGLCAAGLYVTPGAGL
jgi:hypothetical protein